MQINDSAARLSSGRCTAAGCCSRRAHVVGRCWSRARVDLKLVRSAERTGRKTATAMAHPRQKDAAQRLGRGVGLLAAAGRLRPQGGPSWSLR